MPNAKDIQTSKYIRALLIGKSGTRKTTVAGSFPKPMYSADFDQRIVALQGLDIDYDIYTRLSGWKKFESKFNGFLEDAKKGTLKYQTIHVASITTILGFFLWEAKQHYGELKDSKGQPSGFRVRRPQNSGELLMSDMPHFKYVHAALDDFLYTYMMPLSAVCNIVVEAHEMTQYDKEGNPVGDKLLASDSIAEVLPTTFNETWQFKYERPGNPKMPGEYKVFFRNNFLAKTSFRGLPDSVVINDKEHIFYDEFFKPSAYKIGG